ncbi:MAG TPA: YetF domain-containing protein [Sphingopyxis sp.]|nr:YetF domain-containing protein [Sphingopyxis sp.]
MDIILRATVMFFIMYLLLRLLGKRELTQVTPFELVLLIVMGDLVQQGITHNDLSLTGSTLAISTIAFWALALSWITYLSPWAERLLDGVPRVLIQNGQIVSPNMRRDRITRTELETEMRMAGIAKISDVAYAIMEPHGKISFIRADGDQSSSLEKDDDAAFS